MSVSDVAARYPLFIEYMSVFYTQEIIVDFDATQYVHWNSYLNL